MSKERTVALCCISLTLAVSVGCANRINKMMTSWVGHHYSELLESWGAPDRIVEDGRGGKIIVYEEYVGGGSRGCVSPSGHVRLRNTGYVRKREFFTDQDGIIRAWRWKGL